MRRDFLLGIGLLALAAAGAGSALAADLPVAGRPAAVAPVASPMFVPDWVGFYVGINGGGGWSRSSTDQQTFFTSNFISPEFFAVPDTRPSGGVFGFQFGHNWQWGPVVGGLEIDFDGADIKETTTFLAPFPFNFNTFTREDKIEELASARGRLGYLVLPNWLLYGTAGIGWAHSRLTTTNTFVFDGFNSFTSATSYANQFGWVAGVGLEWKFWPGSNSWLLRGEWLHYDFGRVTHNDTAFPFPADNLNIRTTVDIGRAALSYKF